MNVFLGILLLLAALFLIVAVLLQNGKSKGTGVVTGGAETFFGKTKGKSIDKKLSLLTTIVAIVFVLLVIIVFVSQDFNTVFGNGNSGVSSGSDALTSDTGNLSDDVQGTADIEGSADVEGTEDVEK